MLNCRNILIHGALIIKSTLIKEYKYNNKYVYSQDFELYHRLIQDGFDISYDASNISYKLRAHRGQISVKSSDSQSVFFNRVIEKYKKCTVSNGMYLLLLDISFFFLELFKKRK